MRLSFLGVISATKNHRNSNVRNSQPHATEETGFIQGCQVVMNKKGQINPKKKNSVKKGKIQDKHTTTPLKHSTSLLKGYIYVMLT